MLIFAVVLTAVDYLLSKLYQKSQGNTLESGLRFNFLVGLFSAIMFLAINKFRVEFTLFSCVLAVIMTAIAIIYIIMGFTIIADGKTAYYVFFRSVGSMVVPYIWGLIFLKEEFSLLSFIGLIFITFSIFLMNSERSSINFKSIILCFCVFLLAGAVGVISKQHSISDKSVAPIDYVILTSFVKIILCGGLLLFFKLKNKRADTAKISKLSVSLICAASAAVTGIAYMIQLFSAKDMPATLLYPILTGGTIIFSTIFARIIFKEKLSLKGIVAIAVCFAGTFMFV